MTERTPDASMDRIREHARAQVARTSLRKVAKKAGAKVGATKKFIDGSVPYERNARIWKKWYARELKEGRAEAGDDALPPEDAAMVLETLFWGLPAEQHGAAVREVADVAREIFSRAGYPPPVWAQQLGTPLPDEPDDGPDGEDDDED